MSRLLAFGAGPEREGFISEAARAGHEVHVIHNDDIPKGIESAAAEYRCDLMDHKAVFRLVENIKPKAILPTPLGRTLITAGSVNEKYKLRGIKYKAADVCTDKSKMSHIMKMCGISFPKQIEAYSKDDIFNAAQRIDFPLIIKPSKGSGTRGVFYVESHTDLPDIVNKHLNTRDNDSSVVERFVDGDEYGLDAAVADGEISILLIRKKLLTQLPHRLIEGYIAPAQVSAVQKMKIEQWLRLFTKASGMDNCLIHADLIINDREVFFIEISGRPAGIFLVDKFLPYCTGVDAVRQSIKMILGDPSSFRPLHGKFHGISYLPLKGKVMEIPSQEEINSFPGLKEHKFYFQNNDKFPYINGITDIFSRGYAIFEGNNENDILEKIEKFIKIIKTEK